MDDEYSANGRAEAWPRMGRQPSSVMQRPNPPARLNLPQTLATRHPRPQPSPSPSPSRSSKSSSTHSGYPQNPSYYSVSPPPTREGLPTSAPLIRQRTGPSDPRLHAGVPGFPHFVLTNGELAPCSSPSRSRAATPAGREDTVCNHHQHRGHERSDSTDTIRGPLLSMTTPSDDTSSRTGSMSSNYPMTPFPEYAARSDGRGSMVGSPAATVLRTSSIVHGGEGQKHRPYFGNGLRNRSCSSDRRQLVLVLREEEGDLLGALPRLQRSLTSTSSSMHGLMLGFECMVLLMVGSALLWVTVSKKTASDRDLWAWLWTVGEPLVGVPLLLCFAILVTHEVRPLSTVVHLYLQSGVLLLTTLAAVTLVARCLGHESRAVKGVITGCCMWMWVTAFLGFLRAVVVWRVESTGSEHDGERDHECGSDHGGNRGVDCDASEHDGCTEERNAVAYGTFTLVERT